MKGSARLPKHTDSQNSIACSITYGAAVLSRGLEEAPRAGLDCRARIASRRPCHGGGRRAAGRRDGRLRHRPHAVQITRPRPYALIGSRRSLRRDACRTHRSMELPTEYAAGAHANLHHSAGLMLAPAEHGRCHRCCDGRSGRENTPDLALKLLRCQSRPGWLPPLHALLSATAALGSQARSSGLTVHQLLRQG